MNKKIKQVIAAGREGEKMTQNSHLHCAQINFDDDKVSLRNLDHRDYYD